jgi:hypothetical protein
MANSVVLTWSDNEPNVQLSSVDDLDKWLDEFTTSYSEDLPTIITIDMHDHQVGIGVGLQQSFVHIEHVSGLSPYLITVSDNVSDGYVAFLLHGQHHTEIPKRNLIPAFQARQIVREFCVTGNRSTNAKWEEV